MDPESMLAREKLRERDESPVHHASVTAEPTVPGPFMGVRHEGL